IKVNNLEEPDFINLLYKAGHAGVKINLIVRSICCIVPGIPGESNNITVKRIIDRYLEHSRILIFGTDENAEVLMGSADLMTRNLRHRIEVYVTIKNQQCKRELLEYFKIQWRDNDKAVMLLPGFRQERINEGNATTLNAQQSIYNFLEMKQ
ncbi:MAG: polyphosphate kinase 1, partial [Ginsengibacter sp.]